MKCSTQHRTLEVWTSDMVAKFHSELGVVTLWNKRDWAAESKHFYSKVLITLSEVFFVNQGHRKRQVIGERMNYSPLAWVLKLTAQNQQLLK